MSGGTSCVSAAGGTLSPPAPPTYSEKMAIRMAQIYRKAFELLAEYEGISEERREFWIRTAKELNVQDQAKGEQPTNR